ncbi:MAG: nucleoside triphosphate pyrophosphohydrolase [Xanthobacteraceae bacterium]
MTPSRDIATLLQLMSALRTPGSGCPWDLEQTFATIAPYTIEEAYEVAEAITAKLVRRHPHVFGDARPLPVDAVNALWDRIKAEEKVERAAGKQAPNPSTAAGRGGALDGVPAGLPALVRALKLQVEASKVGFDWNDPLAVLAKIREEADEIEAAIKTGERDRIAGEVGDLMFAAVNLARHLDADPESALRATNLKFERRFAAIEAALAAQGRSPQDASLAEMDALWDAAKAAEQAEP